MRDNLYNDIALRTQGDIYIGVVGPVRTGKATFIKRFMDLLVLPNGRTAPIGSGKNDNDHRTKIHTK